MSGPLAAAAVLLAFAAAWELAGGLGGALGPRAGVLLARLTAGRVASFGDAALRFGLPGRIERAGLADRLEPTAVILAKIGGAVVGCLVALVAAPALPGRLALAAAALLVVAGFLGPDAVLERRARRRRDALVSALPDALDMLAVGAASGRGTATLLDEVAGGTAGPLATELAAAVAQIECGTPVRSAVEDMRRRVDSAELGGLAAALERSRIYGSPLAEQLHEQATTLRRDARRRIEERAARAAPKIQLVVALVLVPSVLLMLLAAIIAHADSLFGAL